MEEILNGQISGFHQYILSDPIRLHYVSQNLCEMVGIQKVELLTGGQDRYAMLVHPGDRQSYSRFIRQLAQKEQTLTIEYRLVKKDGAVISVRDTAVSRKNSDGILVGSSVLTDITDLKNEINDLQFLNETIPCGFLRYT